MASAAKEQLEAGESVGRAIDLCALTVDDLGAAMVRLGMARAFAR